MLLTAVRNAVASSVHRITLPTLACRAALRTAKASSVLSMSTSSRPEESEVNQGKTSFQESYGSSPSVTDEPDKLYRQLDLEVRGHDHAVLKSYRWFVLECAKHLGITVVKTWEPSKTLERKNRLKSAFSHRKHIVQYEARTYYQVIVLEKLTGSTAETFLEYIERNIPEGVAMKVTKHEIQPLPEHLKQRPPELLESEI